MQGPVFRDIRDSPHKDPHDQVPITPIVDLLISTFLENSLMRHLGRSTLLLVLVTITAASTGCATGRMMSGLNVPQPQHFAEAPDSQYDGSFASYHGASANC